MSPSAILGSLALAHNRTKWRPICTAAFMLLVSWSNDTFAQALEPVKQASKPEANAPGNGIAADTPPTVEQCLESHRACQQAQNDNDLLVARQWAASCSRLACPSMLVADCVRWINDLDLRIPSVVFEVRLDGVPHPSAKIEMDGKPLDEWRPGEPTQLLPGKHNFRFVVESHQPIEQTVLLAEGMKYRIVSVEFKTVASPPPQPVAPVMVSPPPTSPRYERPVPILVYPLLGLGVIGLGGFAGFAIAGQSEFDRLRDSCAPTCSDDEVSKARSRFLVGNISLGIGAAALVGAGVLYFTRPDQAIMPTVGFDAIPNGGMATLRVRGF